MSELISICKGSGYLEVHQKSLPEHKRRGWVECDKRELPSDKQPKPEAPNEADAQQPDDSSEDEKEPPKRRGRPKKDDDQD